MSNIFSKEYETRYYGVTQFYYNNEYRYIYDEETLGREIYGGRNVPDTDCIECGFPMANGTSATWIERLHNDKEARAFLERTPGGPDYDDPLLVDIDEYTCRYGNNGDDWTREFMSRLGVADLVRTSDGKHLRDRVNVMAAELKQLDPEELRDIDFDYDCPFRGTSGSLHFSELYKVYEKYIREV